MKYSSKSFVLIALALTIFTVIACASSSKAVMPSVAPAPSSSAMVGQGRESNISAGYSGADTADAAVDDRKIVKTGSITIEVPDIDKSLDDISAIASRYNGYVVNSNQSANTDNPTGRISIRVPADKYNDALKAIKEIATKVNYETTNSQDVTEQYMDLKAQLHNLEATEAQYLELLKKAENVQDILEVQRELSNVRGNIERTKGRIQYIERTSDTSLIEVNLRKSTAIGQSTWDIPGIFKSAVDGLIILGKILVGILIWLLVFSPLWILILVIVFIAMRRKKKRQNIAQ